MRRWLKQPEITCHTSINRRRVHNSTETLQSLHDIYSSARTASPTSTIHHLASSWRRAARCRCPNNNHASLHSTHWPHKGITNLYMDTKLPWTNVNSTSSKSNCLPELAASLSIMLTASDSRTAYISNLNQFYSHFKHTWVTKIHAYRKICKQTNCQKPAASTSDTCMQPRPRCTTSDE